jgi:hypothetical protein
MRAFDLASITTPQIVAERLFEGDPAPEGMLRP